MGQVEHVHESACLVTKANLHAVNNGVFTVLSLERRTSRCYQQAARAESKSKTYAAVIGTRSTLVDHLTKANGWNACAYKGGRNDAEQHVASGEKIGCD